MGDDTGISWNHGRRIAMQVISKMTSGILILSMDSTVEIDIGNSDTFKAQALQDLAGHARVILDVSPISFFDSAGMGVLLSLKKKARDNGGDLLLAGLRPAIHEIFQMIGFDTVFKIFPDVPAALQDFNEGQS
jgi:anti-sigma B factor antagonist